LHEIYSNILSINYLRSRRQNKKRQATVQNQQQNSGYSATYGGYGQFPYVSQQINGQKIDNTPNPDRNSGQTGPKSTEESLNNNNRLKHQTTLDVRKQPENAAPKPDQETRKNEPTIRNEPTYSGYGVNFTPCTLNLKLLFTMKLLLFL